jgi:hypothetical protein
MATIPRTYLTTSKTGLSSIPLKNGQVIAIWDADEVWYDAPDNGERDGAPVRRRISGVKIISELPESPMEDIVYVYIGSQETLPGTDTPLYDIRVWVNDAWLIVGTNKDDQNVKTEISNDKFYLVGTSSIDDTVGTLLKNSSVYVTAGEIYGNLKGRADSANNADRAEVATLANSAINDNAATPKAITSYLNNVSSNATTNLGSTLTFTKGDGTSVAVRVSDTTYKVFTDSTSVPGLVAGTDTRVDSDSTGLVLSGSGWLPISSIVMPSAEKATNDGLNQNIANTYIKALAYDTSTDILTVTQGNGNTSSISIPDTQYSVFNTSTNGLVPMASGTGATSRFLRGDGQWASVVQPTDVYQGATSTADGVDGLVPHASAGQTESYFKGDGTWGGVFAEGVIGLVPAPTSAETDNFLKGDGTWSASIDTKNTAGATNNTTDVLYLIGTPTQSTNPQTYSNGNVFIDTDKLYSNNAEVVNVSDIQSLTNKTYEGYTLGSASEGTLASTIQPAMTTTAESFTGDGSTTTFTFSQTVLGVNSAQINEAATTDYTFDLNDNTITFTTAPANNADILVLVNISNSAYNPDEVPKNSAVINYVTDQIDSVYTQLGNKLDGSVICPEYDDTQTYAVGDYCMYTDTDDTLLYKCIIAVTSPEDFDNTKWQVTTLIDVIKSM